MNTYKLKFFSLCPVNSIRIEYKLRIRSNTLIHVEDLIAFAAEKSSGFHEEIADAFFLKFGGEQRLKAFHHGVRIKTIRY